MSQDTPDKQESVEAESADNSQPQTLQEQLTTGKPTRKAGSTYLGPAKPDDPVYKEGWTITLGGLRGQLKKPSCSTPPVPEQPEPDKK